MAKAFGIAALVVFVLSAAAHVATFIPGIPINMQMVWPLHLLAMAAFAPMVFSLAAHQRKRRPSQGTNNTLIEKWRATNKQNKEFYAKLIRLVPLWIRIGCGIAFVYTFINFFFFFSLTEGGSPVENNGSYILQDHGRKIRDISKQEYDRLQAFVVRGFSGHWIVFSLVPAAYFLVVYPRLGELKESDPEKAE